MVELFSMNLSLAARQSFYLVSAAAFYDAEPLPIDGNLFSTRVCVGNLKGNPIILLQRTVANISHETPYHFSCLFPVNRGIII